MRGTPGEYLEELLRRGPLILGQIHVSPSFSLCHAEDLGKDGLALYAAPHAALELSKYTDSGLFRPLKSANDLCHGWRLDLASVAETLEALDIFYPAALAIALAFRQGRCRTTPLSATLERQTGMYAIVRKLTDEQAFEVEKSLCRHRCLREIAWEPCRKATHSSSDNTPLWCIEACSLFVGEARRLLKADPE